MDSKPTCHKHEQYKKMNYPSLGPRQATHEDTGQPGSAPHSFGDRIGQFERDLRGVLADASSSGRFSVRLADSILRIWRPS